MSTVLYEKKNRLVIITINRPEVMNCIDPETDKKLAEAWNQFKDDDGAFVAVITAAGDRGTADRGASDRSHALQQPHRYP